MRAADFGPRGCAPTGMFGSGEKDSRPIVSEDLASARVVYRQVLNDLFQRRQESFCTFESIEDTGAWFQVNGVDLAQGNCPWPHDGGVADRFRQVAFAIPRGLEVVEDTTEYGGERVVTFNSEGMSVDDWVDLIDAFMTRICALPPQSRIRGFVTRAD